MKLVRLLNSTLQMIIKQVQSKYLIGYLENQGLKLKYNIPNNETDEILD